MIEGADALAKRIIRADFDSERALSGSGQHFLNRELRSGQGMHFQTQDSRLSKHDGVKLALLKFSESGLYVPADWHHIQVRAAIPQLCSPSLAAGADARLRGQVVQFQAGFGDQAVQNRFSLRNSGQHKARVLFSWEVFQGMNGNVCFIIKQGLLNAFCE